MQLSLSLVIVDASVSVFQLIPFSGCKGRWKKGTQLTLRKSVFCVKYADHIDWLELKKRQKIGEKGRTSWNGATLTSYDVRIEMFVKKELCNWNRVSRTMEPDGGSIGYALPLIRWLIRWQMYNETSIKQTNWYHNEVVRVAKNLPIADKDFRKIATCLKCFRASTMDILLFTWQTFTISDLFSLEHNSRTTKLKLKSRFKLNFPVLCIIEIVIHAMCVTLSSERLIANEICRFWFNVFRA